MGLITDEGLGYRDQGGRDSNFGSITEKPRKGFRAHGHATRNFLP